MAHAEGSIVIDRPAKLVFDYVLDGTNNTLWRPSVIQIKRSSKATGLGATYRQIVKGPGGSRVDGDYKIVECLPNERIRFEVTSGPARPTGEYRFEALGNSTRVHFILDFKPKGLARLMDTMVEKAMQEEVAVLPNLKKVLERS
jgi:uncharacterized membrane protein